MSPQGRTSPPLRLLPTWLLSSLGIVGLVAGWLFRRLLHAAGQTPLLSWGQPLALLVAGLVLGGVAVWTWRQIHLTDQWLEPRLAVNRLVLGRACALVGVLVCGAYAGVFVSWLGDQSSLASQQLVRSASAALAAGLVVGASLLLERACRAGNQE